VPPGPGALRASWWPGARAPARDGFGPAQLPSRHGQGCSHRHHRPDRSTGWITEERPTCRPDGAPRGQVAPHRAELRCHHWMRDRRPSTPRRSQDAHRTCCGRGRTVLGGAPRPDPGCCHSCFDGVRLSWRRSRDALTTLAITGREVPDIEFGTAVVPTYPRHPLALAAQALTVQEAVGGRLVLGVGVSHQAVVEGQYGYSMHAAVITPRGDHRSQFAGADHRRVVGRV
jgi:hypothetical protein